MDISDIPTLRRLASEISDRLTDINSERRELQKRLQVSELLREIDQENLMEKLWERDRFSIYEREPWSKSYNPSQLRARLEHLNEQRLMLQKLQGIVEDHLVQLTRS